MEKEVKVLRTEVTKDGVTREYFDNGFVIDKGADGTETIYFPNPNNEMNPTTIIKYPNGEHQILKGNVVMYDSRDEKTKEEMKKSLNERQDVEKVDDFEYKSKDDVSKSDTTTRTPQPHKDRDR